MFKDCLKRDSSNAPKYTRLCPYKTVPIPLFLIDSLNETLKTGGVRVPF